MSDSEQLAAQSEPTFSIQVDGKKISKKKQARKLFDNIHKLDRKDIVNKFEDLGIARASAITYASEFAREMAENLGLEAPRVPNPNTISSRVFNIYTEHSTKKQREIILLIQQQLGISPASAATHCTLAKKRFNLKA